MRNLPVHWSEGMFLRPHHFQAADRHWIEQQQVGEQWDHQFYYGLREIEFSRDALANNQFQIHVLSARMKDGTLISLQPGQEPDRLELKSSFKALGEAMVDLTEAFSQNPSVRVYLGVPKLQLGGQNVGMGNEGTKPRFLPEDMELQDETQGGNDQLVQLKRLNVRLLLSTQDLSGYELLPIAQIDRSGEREASPKVDANYFPPMLAADAWPELGRDIVRAIYDIIGKKIEVLSEQVINRGISLQSQEPGDLDRIIMLSQLNVATTTLGVLAFAKGVHPFIAYTELCRIVGQLSIFDATRRPPEIPRYDHDDLAPIFKYIKAQIERLIDTVRDYEYEQRYFVGVGLGMQVTLKQKWLNSDWQWYVGVNKGDLSEEICRALLSAGQLDWKLGSSRQVEALFINRMQGVSLTPMARAPRALPLNKDWLYYEVTRGNPAWNDVQETQTLAMRLKDSLIVNRGTLQGQQKMVVQVGGQQYTLQFALFAVPIRQ